jgi:Mg2+ and Co2+ transporter CorA
MYILKKGEKMKIIKGLVYTDKQYIELLEKRIKELEEEIVEKAHNEYKLNETIINFHDVLCNNQSIINDLRTKINKAIEYKQSLKTINEFAIVDCARYFNKIEKILKGEDNEN